MLVIGTRVKVMMGVYQGQKGIITSIRGNFSTSIPVKYFVQLDCGVLELFLQGQIVRV